MFGFIRKVKNREEERTLWADRLAVAERELAKIEEDHSQTVFGMTQTLRTKLGAICGPERQEDK